MPSSAAARKKFRPAGSISTEPTRLLDWAEEDAKLSVLQVTDQPSLLFVCNGVTGEKVPLRLVLALRVVAVKRLLENLFGFPADEIQLSYKGRVLGNRQTLLDGGVEARQCIHVTTATGVGQTRVLEILVDATRSGISEPFKVRVRPCDLVIHAKKQIAQITGLMPDSQRLASSGQTLANERRLCDCGLSENTILQVTCTNGAATATKPSIASIATSGSRAPRAQMDASAKKRCQGSCLFLTILQTWPPQRKQRLWLRKARTIRQLKEGLEDQCKVIPDQQILMHAGRTLQDQHTLEYYNFEGGECLQLMAQGGAQGAARSAVAEGPVALRPQTPKSITLPLPPAHKPQSCAPDWNPRAPVHAPEDVIHGREEREEEDRADLEDDQCHEERTEGAGSPVSSKASQKAGDLESVEHDPEAAMDDGDCELQFRQPQNAELCMAGAGMEDEILPALLQTVSEALASFTDSTMPKVDVAALEQNSMLETANIG